MSMDIEKLDINQCPGEYYTPNAFKRTHKCDDKTSYVSIFDLPFTGCRPSLTNSIAVCANSRKRIQDWRIQVHVQAGIRVSF